MNELETRANEIVDRLKEIVKEGSVTHIRVKKDDTTFLNIPMTVGVVGTILGAAAAPWALIITAITTLGFHCKVEVEKENGETTVIYGDKN